MKSNMNQIIKYGLFLGLVFVVLSVIVYVFNLITISLWASTIIGALNLAILVTGLVIAGKHYRNKIKGGFVRFGEIFMVLVMVIVFSSLISTAYTLLFSTVIDPGYETRVKAELVQKTVEYMYNKGVPDAQIDQIIDQMSKENDTGLAMKMVWTFIGSMIFGIIISLIVSLIIKKNPPLFSDIEEAPVSESANQE